MPNQPVYFLIDISNVCKTCKHLTCRRICLSGIKLLAKIIKTMEPYTSSLPWMTMTKATRMRKTTQAVTIIQETQVQEEEVQSKKIQVRPWEMQICTIYSRVAELFGANTFLARLLHVRFYTCIFTASLV